MDLRELGAFLRSRRDRVRPADVGLPAGSRRRVPGLRREEVAALAGTSVDYYNELEQGRGAQPSEQMLAALARAVRLTADERDHVFFLAGRQLPPSHGSVAHVHPGMVALLERLPDTPAAVITDLHVTLLQNQMAVALLGALEVRPGLEGSFVLQWFTDPRSRLRYHPDEHDHQSHLFVADLRAVSARRAKDPQVVELVRRLRSSSAEFDHLWAEREVAVRRSDRKRLVHPQLGVIEVDCVSLLSEDGTQRLLWFSPAPGGIADAQFERLALTSPQSAENGSFSETAAIHATY